ncbi:MAG: tetratricopeptide repeat protein [Prochloraceae cyanobacterium]|nr:tetratricopeptide repeat protein [Prochloraceae cyanobacterium]
MELIRELYNTGTEQLALSDLNQLIKNFPYEGDVYITRGWFYRDRKEWTLALADFNKAIKLSPTLASAYLERALLYHRLGNYNAALTDYYKVLGLDKDYFVPIVNIGLIAYEKSLIQEAIAQWQKAVKINNSVEAKLALGVALYFQGEQETAFENAETALKCDRQFAELKYLQENLWAKHLLTDAAKFLATSRMQNFLELN